MSRPFVLLYTRCSGVDQLLQLLGTHPFVNIRTPQFDKERPSGPAVVPEARRIEVLERLLPPNPKRGRRAVGVALRIGRQEGHVQLGSVLLDKLRGWSPAVIVLRDDNLVMQAVERLTHGAEAPVEIDTADLQQALRSVRQDYGALDEVAEQLGPVMEIARDEIADAADMLMSSVVRLLELPDAERTDLPPEAQAALPELEKLVSNPDQVRAFAAETEFAGEV